MKPAKYDTGRQRVYVAERQARKRLWHHHQRFETLIACQDFAETITSLPVWQALGGPCPVRLKAMPRLGKRSWFVRRRSLGLTKFKTDPDTGQIAFSHISLAPREMWKASMGGWDNFTILHELAHAVNPWQEKHGAGFLSAHLKLIEASLGPDARETLKNAYMEHGLHLPPE
ncbi:MAG: hypothetical protein ACON4J_00765 [Parvibaculales bacterium]